GLVFALAVQIVGFAGLMISLLQIDLGQFTGLSQVLAYLNGERLPLPTEPLQTGGVYRLVRHPLYLFSLLLIWPMPIMTEALLAFNLVSTWYFAIGSLLEERRMLALFGDEYAEYRQRVPWLIPFVR
ncbi:MAG: isoprenylcysteine carboxylmethyltransferase family protein, partial [Chloroflexi bacterium]|nr:isoprenylcysteine carboxylmethyltransferase family protein [Chloroflexota bacterium]